MTLEQSAELNKHNESTIPWNWAARRKVLSVMLPVLVFLLVIVTEFGIAFFWVEAPAFLMVAPLIIAITLYHFCRLEVRIRRMHRTKRVLQLEDGWIVLQSDKAERFKWDHVYCLRLAPLALDSSLSKLSVELQTGSNQKPYLYWSIVLKNPEQVQGLKSKLEHLRQKGITSTSLIEMSEPIPMEKPRMLSRWMFFLAVFFILHGVPLLLTGLSFPRDGSNHWTPRASSVGEKRFERFLMQHFSNPDGFCTFCIAAGGSLISLGCLIPYRLYKSAQKPDSSVQSR